MVELRNSKTILNLTFHSVGESQRVSLELGEESVWLDVPTFNSILDAVWSQDNVFVTVDDGNISDIEVVLPAVLERGMKAAFFLSAGLLDSRGFLGRKDVQGIAEAGMIVGTHGMRHRNWRQLDDEELLQELYVSRDILEQLAGQPVRQVACPYGAYDRRVLHHLRKAGFHKVYTSDRGLARRGAWLQPRNTLHCHDTPESVRRLISQRSLDWMGLKRAFKRFVKRWR